MDIIFYTNRSDDNVINKSITELYTLSGTLKTSCNIENPIIIISNNGILNSNYCYIEEFNRYYFITDQTINSNNIITLTMSVDVLMSFRSPIMSLSAIIENSSTDYDLYLPSDILKTNVKSVTDIINFNSGFNDSGEYILITAGG